MQPLEDFVRQAIKQGKDEIDDLEQIQRILDILDVPDKPLYLRHYIVPNTGNTSEWYVSGSPHND